MHRKRYSRRPLPRKGLWHAGLPASRSHAAPNARTGAAFDLPAGGETPRMPTGDQRAANEDTARDSTESAEVPPGGLNPAGNGAS